MGVDNNILIVTRCSQPASYYQLLLLTDIGHTM